MAFVGGVRQRLIKDNFALDIEQGLRALGWYDTGRQHLPVTVIADQFEPAKAIQPNLLGVTLEDLMVSEMEMGSSLEESNYLAFIDVFAENNTIGQHLTGDVLDLLRGKFSQIKPETILGVKNLGSPAKEHLFNCYYENFEVERTRTWDNAYNKFWWTISLDIIDYYMDDRD